MAKEKKVTKKLKYVALILVIVLGLAVLLNNWLPRNVPPAHPTVTAQRQFLLPTATNIPPTASKFPTITSMPSFKTATPYSPMIDLLTTPDIQFFVQTELEIVNRSGKLVSVRDAPGMYYANTSTPSIVIGWLAPGTKWWVEEAYAVGNDVWARMSAQNGYIPLLYNGVYFTNWRPSAP